MGEEREMKNFLVGAVLFMVFWLVGDSSFAMEISPGEIMIFSDSEISIEVNYVEMEGEDCIVEVVYKYRGGKSHSKRERFNAYGFEHYVNLAPNYKLTLFYAGTNGGEVYALLNDKQI